MKANFTPESTPSAGSPKRKARFFESLLIGQLEKIEKGSLVMRHAGTEQRFGLTDEKNPIELDVINPAFFRKACLGGSLGVADSYASGEWHTTDLVGFFRLFLQNLEVLDQMEGGWAALLNKFARWGYLLGQKNTVKGSRRNIALHYDLGNDFYELMLDPTMTYSCGIFASEQTSLEEASLAKYDRIIEQLDIKEGQTVLEIGCGWGGFAKRLLDTTGAIWTGTTISKEQHAYARKVIDQSGHADRANLLMDDYRSLSGSYDRIVSIEMIEAVGHE